MAVAAVWARAASRPAANTLSTARRARSDSISTRSAAPRGAHRLGSELAGEQDHDRIAAGGGDMGGAGVVADGQRGCPRQCGQPGDLGAPDQIDGIGADRTDRAPERLLAGDADDDRQIRGAPKPVR